MLPDLFPGDDFSGPLHQHYKEAVREILHFDPGAISRKRLLSGVQFERTEAVTNPL
jgi:hypothetical protein